MIERHWKGIAGKESKATYIQYLNENTFAYLQSLAGFIASKILTREVAQGIEFLVITSWASMEHIKAFAGDQIEVAVVPQNVADLMISYDPFVTHYRVE